MNISAPFIHRPVATTLLTLGLFLSGIVAFLLLPVAPLPQLDFPTISVSARLPGASPETMAATVATPLERTLGRIAGVTEITSTSSLGSTRVTLQFELDRDINGAARDVQAAINAARSLLPTGMPGNPTYRKVNPADAPIMILALTSDTLDRGQMYDAASTVIAQKLAQLDGIGQVTVGGASLPAVRVELNPRALSENGINLSQVRTAIAATNANRPKGVLETATRQWQVTANDQATRADDYRNLVVSWVNGAAVRLSDVADVKDSVEDTRNAGMYNGKPAVLVILFKQPGSNILATTRRVRAVLPQLEASIPGAIDVHVVMERTATIRASLREVEHALLISVCLVVLVVFAFLRNPRTTLIPAVAVPVSLVSTFGVMYLLGYSLDNLSLMALTIATGFVVDDAIVVLENTMRHREQGVAPLEAALRGAREVGFTVLSMSLSLVAVFIPVLLMGGIVGRLFREFAVTLSVAVAISLLVSLTTTPMLCAHVLKQEVRQAAHGRLYHLGERAFGGILSLYRRSLGWALLHPRAVMLLLAATIGLNIYLYTIVPKGFFPQQDTGRIMGSIEADQSISFQAMSQKLSDFMRVVRDDPAVENVVGFTGGGHHGGTNSGRMFIALKPLGVRTEFAGQVIARLRGKLAHEAGASLFMAPMQDLRVGGRHGNATYQYTLQSDSLDELRSWTPRLQAALSALPGLADVSSDQEVKALQTSLTIDRDSAARLGLSPKDIDSVLNLAFGQAQVSTIYSALNQYHVVMEVAPAFRQSPQALSELYLVTADGKRVPLSAITTHAPDNASLSVSHQGQFAAATISFNLQPGVSLSQATRAIRDTVLRIGMPDSVHGSLQGTARAFGESLKSMPWLILAALVTVYLVLGILYESYVHPLTILSTLPSAGVGAILALMLFHNEFSIIALIGIFLLIGIVKKNAILMIDFALQVERTEGLPPREAIFQACLLRLRPILMTTLAAMLGALPLALSGGYSGALRQPLGLSIIGGLLLSQVLTLYTTPVIYLYLDRFRLWCLGLWQGTRVGHAGVDGEQA
jgi:multidrug efflux pump